MCNLYTQTRSIDEIARMFRELGTPLAFPEGIPNLRSGEIRITDMAPIVRAGNGAPELVERRWSWPGPTGKPVYNFRADGREFESGRCLIIADGFYEFTAPTIATQKRKDKWLFTDTGGELIGIAGLVRGSPEAGEAFTMLTTQPGPDVAPYHGRQVAVLPRQHWRDWLGGQVSSKSIIAPLPARSLQVQQVNGPTRTANPQAE